jgi:hypothetical protein
VRYKFLPLAVTLRMLRADPFILPAAVWALFVIMTGMLHDRLGTNIVSAYLGFTMPLLSGILGAYAILDDPSLELTLSTPRPAWITIGERLGVILAFQAGLALAFQLAAAALGLDMNYLGGPVVRQLAWAIPALAMAALGAAASFLFANCTSGALMAGFAWILQVILRGWFINDETRRCFLLFAGVMAPGYPFVVVNQIVLTGISIGLLMLGVWLFRKQERYL